jgi:puromycin-sensitive aminopeptidase
MDHIAIPDFAAGAMENLGLVTYREEALLLDADKASPRERMWVVGVIAHETAHMWFGDLVTMRWWNGLWLNEAFATFMQTLCTDALHPEWDVWTSYGPQKAYALSVDGLASTRPIEYPVGPPAEAWGMFDALTYEKGGSVLRMLEQYLGPEVFRQGVRHYLTRHRYGNTETSDLWAALEEVSGQPVRAAMDSWVFQGGYPMVLAGVDPEGRALRLVQRPFRYMGDGEGRWQVPVVIGVRRESGGEHRIELLLGADEARIDLPADWTVVVVNRGGWGFYRVAYDDALWSRMLPAWPTLTGLERHGLVDDTWAAALANRGSLERAVTLWGMLDGDRDPDVWAEALRQWRLLDYMIDDRGRDALGRLVRQVGRPWLARLTWDPAPGEDMRTSRLRATVIQALGTIGQDLEVREEALRRFHEHLQGRRVIAGSLLTEVTVLAAAAGGASEWELIYRGFKDPKTPQDLTRNLTALAAFRRPELLARTLDVYFSDAVRVQDGAIAIGAALRNRYAQAETWTRIERQWDDLLAKYPPSMMQHILEPIATIVTDALADRTIAWVDAHPIPEVARMVAQAKDMQAVHRAFAKRLGHTVPVLLTP